MRNEIATTPILGKQERRRRLHKGGKMFTPNTVATMPKESTYQKFWEHEQRKLYTRRIN